MNETEIFIKNLNKVITLLNLSKTNLNKKFGWPLNKLTYLLKGEQSILLEDVTIVRKTLELATSDLLENILTKSEIDDLLITLKDCVKKKNTRQASKTDSPIDYLIVVLNKKYYLSSTFTKKQLLEDLPNEHKNYNIEWSKNRIKKYIEQVKDKNNTGHTFKLSRPLPEEMVNASLKAVSETWLKEFVEKLNIKGEK